MTTSGDFVHSPRDGTSGRPAPEEAAPVAPSEQAAVPVIATGMLVLPAPTPVQVVWLVAVVVGVSSSVLRGRRLPPTSERSLGLR